MHVLACETRPLLQGARLTAWELRRAGIAHELVVDAAAAGLIPRGEVDAVITGFDRVAANGDVANKVGTYPLALAAHAAGSRSWPPGPTSSVDPDTPTGDDIVIEERDADEVPAGLRPGGDAVPQPGLRRHPRRARVGAGDRARRGPAGYAKNAATLLDARGAPRSGASRTIACSSSTTTGTRRWPVSSSTSGRSRRR